MTPELNKPRALNTQDNKELNKKQVHNITSNYGNKLVTRTKINRIETQGNTNSINHETETNCDSCNISQTFFSSPLQYYTNKKWQKGYC